MVEKKLKTYSIEEYIKKETLAIEKNEYEAGRIYAMGGGTINHAIIGHNINTGIGNAIKTNETNCIPLSGDARVYIENANSFVYPDGMVVCGEIETSEHDEHSVVNPILIIEVLSKSSEHYDRGDKFHKYASLPSFKEYLIIDQFKPVVDVLFRADPTYWKMVTTIGLDKSIYINTLKTEISMKDIYENTKGLKEPKFG